MTNSQSPSAEIQKLLKKLESTSVTDGDAAVNLVRLLAYIRTLKEEHLRMKDVLSHIENFGYGDEEVAMVKKVISTITL